MVDWRAPDQIAKDAMVYGNFLHALSGLYIWELFISLDFDWQYITLARPLKWSMVFYFANRYCMLAAIALTFLTLDADVDVTDSEFVSIVFPRAFG
ncbi:hypothetical protein HGRIS_000266 [Hohenbuehelia grisea]|uniref:Uncharacterized protein n=1 Tax=Hohenbuehelia grisea TaxID=104357 RepID=A0ABR3JSG0_9AGAR